MLVVVPFASMRPMHDVSVIETPENVEIMLPLAGIGSRFLAYLVDLAWQSVVLLAALVIVIVNFAGKRIPFDKNPDGTFAIPWVAVAVFDAAVFVVNFFYFAAFEALWRGQTPGKRVCRLRVVRDGGRALDGRGALIRNLVRSVDFLPSFYVVGVIAIFLGRQGKRIGDYAAGTMVVQEARATDLGGAHARAGLRDAESALIGEFLARRGGLSPASRAEVARQLADRLAERHSAPRPNDPEAFLERLARDGLR
jgi:uncharacterized RDD family membrane protein YckC